MRCNDALYMAPQTTGPIYDPAPIDQVWIIVDKDGGIYIGSDDTE